VKLREVVLDVSELEAPMPLLFAKNALEKLGEDEYLHMIHRLSPCLLPRHLEKNGFVYIEIKKEGLYHILIVHQKNRTFLDSLTI